MVVLPSDVTEHGLSEFEDMMVMDSDFMESQDNCNGIQGYV